LAALRRERGVTRIELTGLNDAEVIALMEAAAGHALDDAGVGLAHALYHELGQPLRHEPRAVPPRTSALLAGMRLCRGQSRLARCRPAHRRDCSPGPDHRGHRPQPADMPNQRNRSWQFGAGWRRSAKFLRRDRYERRRARPTPARPRRSPHRGGRRSGDGARRDDHAGGRRAGRHEGAYAATRGGLATGHHTRRCSANCALSLRSQPIHPDSDISQSLTSGASSNKQLQPLSMESQMLLNDRSLRWGCPR